MEGNDAPSRDGQAGREGADAETGLLAFGEALEEAHSSLAGLRPRWRRAGGPSEDSSDGSSPAPTDADRSLASLEVARARLRPKEHRPGSDGRVKRLSE